MTSLNIYSLAISGNNIFAATHGFVDSIPVEHLSRFEKELLEFLNMKYPKLMPEIAERKELDEKIQDNLDKALETFLNIFKFEDS